MCNILGMSKKGYVYLLADSLKDDVYKIGVTRGSIENRVKKLQTGNAGEIYMCRYYQTDIPFFVEKHLHSQFLSKKLKNEWFSLTAEDVLDFSNKCAEIEKIYDALKNNYFFNKDKNNYYYEEEM